MNEAPLANQTCVPCRGDTPPLRGEELATLGRRLPGWEVVEEHHLNKTFRFKNFRESLGFVVRVGELAEEQGHHPDLRFGWGYAEVTVYTHKIDGLTGSDFVLAAKVDALQQ